MNRTMDSLQVHLEKMRVNALISGRSSREIGDIEWALRLLDSLRKQYNDLEETEE